MTVRLCTPGGVTLVVAVAFDVSVDVWQPARIEIRAQHPTIAGTEYLEKIIMVLHGKSIRLLFSPSRLSQKAGREQALPWDSFGLEFRLQVGFHSNTA
jgi:hypothetical protein